VKDSVQQTGLSARILRRNANCLASSQFRFFEACDV
jgi:hypothetical protein